jgi:hypothetical protein
MAGRLRVICCVYTDELGARSMKWVSYTWSVIVGLITVAIALAVTGRFSVPFEQVAVDLLVLTFVAVDGAAATRGMAFLNQAKVDRTRFIELLKAAGSRAFDAGEEAAEAMAEEDTRANRYIVKLYIKGGFVSVIYFVTLWDLLHHL